MPRSLASDGGSIALESVTTTTRCPMAQTLPSDTIGNGRNRDARHAGVRVLRTRIGYEVRVRVVRLPRSLQSRLPHDGARALTTTDGETT